MRLFALFKKSLFILSLLFLIGVSLRVYSLQSVPGGFHEDEAHIGYNAYSLLKTGRDKNNVFLPLAINQFGDFRPAGLHYLTIPSVAIFGLTEFATRLPAALVGAISIIALYFLALEIFQSEWVALMSAGIFTFNPWSIIASRSTSESVVAQFLVMLGALYAIKIFRRQKISYIILSGVFFAISFFFYHAARYFVPFLLVYLGFVFLMYKKIPVKIKMYFGVMALVVILFLGFLFKYGGGSGRVDEISIFGNPATKIMLWQQESGDTSINKWISRLYHNPITAYSYTAASNYFQHFSADFLFLKGGGPPRYQVPWSGNFYLIDGLFFIIGLSFLIYKLFSEQRSDKWIIFLPVIWLLLGPIPAAFTFEDIPHFQRAIMMLPGFILIAGYGVVIFFSALKSAKWRSLTIGLVVILYLYSMVVWGHNYFHQSLIFQPWYRNEGQKDLVMVVDKYVAQGNHVVMTTQNANRLIFYLFYNKVDPIYYQKIGSPMDSSGLHFQNYILDDAPCPANSITYRNTVKYPYPMVFVEVPSCQVNKKYQKVLQTIKRADNTKVFEIVQNNLVTLPPAVSY